MRIRDVHISSKDEVSIKYQVLNDGTKKHDDLSLHSDEPPLPAFKRALAALAPAVCKLNEFPEKWAKEITVVGLAVSFNGKEHRQLIVKAHRSLSQGGPLICNTPQTPMEADDESAFTVDDETADLVDEVCSCAVGYLEGDRAQATMDLEGQERPNVKDGNTTPREQGESDFIAGMSELSNPFDERKAPLAYAEWLEGFRAKEEERNKARDANAASAPAASPKRETAKAPAKGAIDAMAEGRRAWREEVPKESNPYDAFKQKELHEAWDEGWQEYEDAKSAAPESATQTNPSTPPAKRKRKSKNAPVSN